MNKDSLNVNILITSTITKTTLNNVDENKKDPTPTHKTNFQRFIRNEIYGNFKSYKIVKNRKFFCDYNNGITCKEVFLQQCPFKKLDSSSVQKEDSILNNYMLHGIIQENDYTVDITYKLLTTITESTSDYPEPQDSLFVFTTQNIKKCTHLNENGLLNIKCECKYKYFGITCSHKSYTIELNCQEFNMCGDHGKCKKNNKECDSQSTGKYCTNLLKVTEQTKSTTSEISTKSIELKESKIPTNSIETAVSTIQKEKIFNITENGEKNSKKGIIIGISVSLVFLLAVIGSIIFYIKSKY